MQTQEFFIQKCLELANKGKGNVSPNPMVGCVIVYNKSFTENSGINNSGAKTYLGNSKFAEVSMPVTTFFIASGETVLPITEANQAETIARIDKEIDDLVIAKNNGKTIAFDKSGYGIISKNAAENRALLHLSKRLFDEFNYVNPVARRSQRFMDYVYSSQPLNEVVEEEINITPTEIETKDIKFTKDNVDKIVSGVKTTTVRTKGIEDGNYNIGGKIFKLTNRGLLSVEEAGGAEAITQSEAFGELGPKFQHTKDFLAGKRKLYVVDIIPYISEEDVTPECGLGGII